MSAVVLHQGFADSLWSSFFEWTRRRTGSIDTLMADCPMPRLDIALAGLGGQQAALKRAVCRQCSSSSIHLLSTFATLKSCILSAARADICIDLSPLGVLPALCSLELHEGHFRSMTLPPNLLTLSMYFTTCTLFDQVGLTVKSLQQLTVGGSKLSLMPAGIAACVGLQRLDCWSCTICSNEAEHMLYAGPDRHFCMATVISALTCLTYLAIMHNGPSDGPIDLSNIYVLKSLQHLRFRSRNCAASVAVSDGLTALRQLEILDLCVSNKVSSGFDDVDGADPYVELKLNVDWAALANLKHITIEADMFRCRANILKLLNVTSLQTVQFISSQPGDTASSTSFAALMYALARCRPDVCLTLDYFDLPSHFHQSLTAQQTGQFDLHDFPWT